ncbi:MAG: CapA family protein [Cyclobacteriaceae bacterium]|nr:CapA family protein [Cyclobacteriaceae bacterium]
MHRMIDEAGVDIIHGHSSHHPRGIEIYKNKPIIYGAGDFINDYEGIGGHEEYRGDLTLMYFLDIRLQDQDLERMILIPLKIENMQLKNTSGEASQWMADMLNREGRKFNSSFDLVNKNRIELIKNR